MQFIRTLLLLIFFLQNFHYLRSQNSFNKVFGTYFTETGVNSVVLKDTSIMAFGTSSAQPYMSSQFYLVHVNQYGNLLWSKFYGASGVDQATRIIVDSDSTLILVGTVYDSLNTYDIKIIKIDTAGNVLFEKNYGTADWDFASNCIKLNDGTYAVCGKTYGNTVGLADAFVFGFKNNGDSLYFSTNGNAYNNYYYDLVQTTNDTLLLCGEWKDAAGFSQGIISKFSIGGNTFNSFIIHGASNYVCNSIDVNANGDYFVGVTYDSLTTAPDIMALVFSKSNYTVLLNNMTINGTNEEKCNEVRFINNTYQVSAYTTSYGLGNGDAAWFLFDLGGWFVTSRTFGTNEYNELFSMTSNFNNSILFTGVSTYSYGVEDLWLVNLDSLYNASATVSTQLDPNFIVEYDNSKEFKIYPSPFKDKIYIKSSAFNYDFTLMNLQGETILHCKNTNEISVSESISKGAYIFVITQNDKVFTGKLIKF